MIIWAAALGEGVGEIMITGINRAALISLITLGGSIIAYMIFLKEVPYKEESRSPARLLAGDMAFSFWGGVAFSGLAVPIGMSIYIGAARAAHHALLPGVIGLLGVLVGGIAIRALMYRLGSEADPIL